MITTIIILSVIILVAILILVSRIVHLYDIIESQRITEEFWRNEAQNTDPSPKA